MVINISDGAPYSESAGETEDDVKKCADEIRRISFPDGTPRIFNIHISPNGEKDVRFPATNSNLDSYAAFLFDISSEVTPDLVAVIPELMQYHVSGNEKTMMSNVSDPEALAQFLRIGTLPKLR